MTRPLLAFAAAAIVSLAAARASAAPALQAPAGGHAVTLPDSLVACGPAASEWTVEVDPHVVRPPPSDAAIGHAVTIKVAPSLAACASAAATLELIATARLPQIDPSSIVLSVEEGRLDLRGRALAGAGVHWQLGDHAGDDRCPQPEASAGGEHCSFAVGKGLPADPNAVHLSWFPAGGRAPAPEVATFDAAGRRVTAEELTLRPARVMVPPLVPPNVAIDLLGDASRIPLRYPEAAASVDCGAATCQLEGGAIVVRGVRNLGQTLGVRIRLAPRVFAAGAGAKGGDALDAAPTFQVAVLPCSMTVASGDALRDIDDSSVVVKLDSRCAAEAKSLRFVVRSQEARVKQIVTEGGAAYVLLRVGRVEGDSLEVTAQRGETEASVVGVARVRTRRAPLPRPTMELEGGGAIDFIPTNRPAVVRFAGAEGRERLVLLPEEGAYEVLAGPKGTEVRGLPSAAGFVALRFGYRVQGLPGDLSSADLAVLTDPLERPLREANLPAPLGASAMGGAPLVELTCDDGAGKAISVRPGIPTHIPFSARDTCRLLLHKERLAPQDGAQHLTLDVDVTRVDGEARPDAHVSQPIVLRPGADARFAWIKGIKGPFDHVTVRLTHDSDEAHYVGAEELRAQAPSVQWSVIAGRGRARIYATTAIPTGLYRVSDRAHSGILSLNFGVIARLTWLDEEGHEGFLGAEAGVMGVGLANDVDTSGHSLTQVATVWGAGLSVPIANRSLATETSINLHAWGEYEVSRALGGEPGSPLAFVFGPSISIGNIGANL